MDKYDPMLIEYVLGTGQPEEHERIAAAEANDPETAAALRELREALGKATAPPTSAEGGSFPEGAALKDRLLATVEGNGWQGFVDRAAAFLDLDVDEIEAQFTELQQPDSSRWKATGFPGIYTAQLRSGPQHRAATRCVALRMAAGSEFPQHKHLGDEWGLVLQGQLVQHDGKRFGAGDLVHQPTGSSHGFRATSDGEVLQFVVLNGDLEF